jgi:hypothetical protein
MKLYQYALLSLFGLNLLVSCKKSETSSPVGKLQVSFSNEANGQPVGLGPLSYTNGAGNKYSIDLLKYYVTNFTLLKADGTEKNFRNYDLIDASEPTSLSFTLDSVLNGSYTSVSFYLGIDSARNHTGAQNDDLDPVHGMIWSWSTGYIFFKHEGSFKDSAGTTRPLAFHYATDRALVKVTVPINNLSISGDNRKLFLRLNLDKLYNSAHTIDFNVDNNRMSGATDNFWVSTMSQNFQEAFEFVKSE